uniref:Uncharacterized protein n=1 Tax=Lotharella globosa TaxID=91324 RepID=A0A7S3YIT0_9EUKA|mmetsp:Transcript_5465/g.10717  ORF Transcript_5465/g.10717 Transcript_5465/m.10717 type:complete len:166 (-) Transcript_5465:185-682(-)
MCRVPPAPYQQISSSLPPHGPVARHLEENHREEDQGLPVCRDCPPFTGGVKTNVQPCFFCNGRRKSVNFTRARAAARAEYMLKNFSKAAMCGLSVFCILLLSIGVIYLSKPSVVSLNTMVALTTLHQSMTLIVGISMQIVVMSVPVHLMDSPRAKAPAVRARVPV